jgi:hypothetical protein
VPRRIGEYILDSCQVYSYRQKDAANTFVTTMKLSVDAAVRELKNLGATVDQTVKALAPFKEH